MAWCEEVNSRRRSEIHAIPGERLATERGLLGELPSLCLEVGPKPLTRKVDKLSLHPVRIGPLLGAEPADRNPRHGAGRRSDGVLRVVEPVTGEVHAEHQLVAPGETSIVDVHYDRPRPDTPRRGARPRTAAEREFPALGVVAEQFLTGAAAGVTKLNTEIGVDLTLGAATATTH